MYFYYIKKETIIQLERRIFMLIGICGKSGSGKSTLAEEIKKKYPEKTIHIDIDKIGHYILEIQEVKIELIRHFKKNILTNNKIDRKKVK